MENSKQKRKTLSPEEKHLVYDFLVNNNRRGVLQRGKVDEAASSFGVCRRTIQNVWATAKKARSNSAPVIFKSNKLGVPKKNKLVLDSEKMKSIPFESRGNIESLAEHLQVNKSTVGRWVKNGTIQAHTNAIKPDLTLANKIDRVKYALKDLEVDAENNVIKFGTMHNYVHIDEKWFYMKRTSERYYLVPGEEAPHRTCKSKRYIQKVMFMCAVARPHYATDGSLIWDGKIGMFPFTQQVPAQRNSRNRARGTLVTKPIDSITKEVTKSCLLTQIIPAIKALWPANASKDIYIQQDNAPPHINNNDSDFRAAASSDGFNIQLIFQPPNSPDSNINDLGWFRAIQSLQVKSHSHSVEGLVENVMRSFENLSHTSLNNVFLSLQGCMIEMMKVGGGNNYKQPHMKKASLINQGRLPVTLEVDEVLVRECINKLEAAGQLGCGTYDFGTLMLNLGYA